MQMIIDYARVEGLKTIEGQVLSENTTMLAMCRELGFSISPDPSDPDACCREACHPPLACGHSEAGDDSGRANQPHSLALFMVRCSGARHDRRNRKPPS